MTRWSAKGRNDAADKGGGNGNWRNGNVQEAFPLSPRPPVKYGL